ncbi:MAG: glycoside hydrolase family 127 protein [Eubacteriales bacterium]|nr:glycoside hydrolase family 127 protein [Eubacteriales bacterium]
MAKINTLSHENVRLTEGFWKNKRELGRDVTLMSIYDRFAETGRFASLDFNHPDPHIFWDSDIAKWIESAAYLLEDKRDEAVEQLVDDAVEKIALHQRPDGYFNIHFDTKEPGARFSRYTDHELYDLGHLIEAAIAYKRATGKRKLLDVCIKYVELVDKVFRVEHTAGFDTPGHEEIELALYRLWQETGEERFLTLMRYFINTRGTSPRDNTYAGLGRNSYAQSHLPVREQTTAEGHSVRAMYLYCAMADMAWHDNDEGLRKACETLFDNVVNKRMYVTGGIGSSHVGEAFTFDYDLMNRTAYTETCASLALALFARRMSRIEPKGIYADIAELALYNGTLSGISVSGDSFFYENPLEIQPAVLRHNQYYVKDRDYMPISERVKVFSCSCCPPNLLRVIGSVGEFAYGEDETTLYSHLFMGCEAETKFGKITQTTSYPYEGTVEYRMPEGAEAFTLAVHLPAWAEEGYTLTLNGGLYEVNPKDGYLYITREWKPTDVLKLEMPFGARLVYANPAVHEDCGRVAVMRGPIVYCAEEVDNGRYVKDIAVSAEAEYTVEWCDELQAPILRTIGSRRVWPNNNPLYTSKPAKRMHTEIVLIPYACFANRGETEMSVWLLEE